MIGKEIHNFALDLWKINRSITGKGTKLNLSHIIKEMMDQDELDEIHAFFKSTVNFSFDEARLEFAEDEFTDDEIRLLRIDFISQVAN